MRLAGKAAVVTGSGQSIGRAIAQLLAAEGASVIVNSRTAVSRDDTPTAQDCADEINAAGGRAVAVFADVATMSGAARIVESCVEQFGGIDILVNNAGGGSTVRIEEMDETEWDRVIGMNLRGTYATAHYAVPHLKRRGGGRIINIISRVGLAGSATMSAYAAAKAGTVGFSFALAKELAADAITVNCVAPTANSVRAMRTAEERYAMIGRVIPASSNRTPAHIAPLVAHLASDETAGITGQIFYTAAGEITRYDPPVPARTIFKQGMWSLDELSALFPSAFGSTLSPPESPLPPV